MQDNVYRENFRKTNVEPSSLLYVMDQIRQVHSADAGWEVGEPVIESKNPDGTINFYVPLTKYPVEKTNGRSY